MSPIHASALRSNELSSLKLPTLPAGTPFLLQSLTNEDIEFTELAELLEKFPSIAGKLISLANSAWSAPASEISSLEVTCSRLGFGVVRSTSIALAVAAPFDATKCADFEPELFWCSSLMTANAASALASALASETTCAKLPEPSTARAAGLLHNLGLLWLVDRVPDTVSQALASVANDPSLSLGRALMQVQGFDHAEAGGYLARAWNLPEPLIMALRHYRDADYRGPQQAVVNCVGLAADLVASVLRETPCPDPDARLAGLGADEACLQRIHETLRAQLPKIRTIARLLV